MIVFPPSKINLGLFVTEKRNDGFHDLETVFLEIPLCDILEVYERKTGKEDFFKSTGLNIPDADEKNNLCVKAANLFYKKYQISENLKAGIHLHKIIPMGAGLGGGSADAVYTLKALYKFYQLEENKNDIFEMAVQLGSDCAFFIDGKAQLAKGRGEVLSSFEIDLSDYFIAIVKAPIHVSTALAFSKIKPQKAPLEWTKTLTQSPADWKNTIKNDFEESVFQNFKEIADIKQKLYDLGADFSLMSGSGASVFALFKQKPNLENQFPKTYFVWEKKIKSF
jgi:4-diphosphocytidyl-2-C-methyl-D-erythritol kinase